MKEDFVSIKVDQKKAQQLGLSLSTIKDEINSKFLSFPAGNVTSGDISVPVRVEEQLKTIKELKSLDLTPSSQGTAQKSSGQESGSGALLPENLRPELHKAVQAQVHLPAKAHSKVVQVAVLHRVLQLHKVFSLGTLPPLSSPKM